jgi:hypothetical protein
MRLRTLKRLRRLTHDPLAPLVYIAIFGVLAYGLFIVNWLTHQW